MIRISGATTACYTTTIEVPHEIFINLNNVDNQYKNRVRKPKFDHGGVYFHRMETFVYLMPVLNVQIYFLIMHLLLNLFAQFYFDIKGVYFGCHFSSPEDFSNNLFNSEPIYLVLPSYQREPKGSSLVKQFKIRKAIS